jgi:hypothetical protein
MINVSVMTPIYTPDRENPLKKTFAGFPTARGNANTTFGGAMKRHQIKES